jgi:hypothetical protein
MLVPDTNPKILFIFIPFLRPGEIPVENTPPAFFPPKNFKTKNPPWVAGAVGLEPWRRWGGWGGAIQVASGVSTARSRTSGLVLSVLQ